MIRHIVMWTIKEGDHSRVKLQRMTELKARLLDLRDKIPEILSLEVHFNAPYGLKENYDVILISEFTTWADLQAYQQHPAHLEVGDYVRNIIESRSCIDFEI